GHCGRSADGRGRRGARFAETRRRTLQPRCTVGHRQPDVAGCPAGRVAPYPRIASWLRPPAIPGAGWPCWTLSRREGAGGVVQEGAEVAGESRGPPPRLTHTSARDSSGAPESATGMGRWHTRLRPASLALYISPSTTS